MSAAQTLRAIAGLMEDGCPKPLAITLLSHGRPSRVQVSSEALSDWLMALDLVEPEWHADMVEERPVLWVAKWPAGTFDDLPFVLDCMALSGAVDKAV